MQDLLSQEEIDALLNGIGSDDIPDDPDEEQLSEVVNYEPGEMQRIERSDLPGLELFSQRFSRQLQAKLFKWFELSVEVSSAGHQYSCLDDYQETVTEPSSLSLLRMPPFHGSSVLVLDSKLVFKLVELFFGGAGGHARIQSRAFSSLELRVTELFLEHLFASMIYAWKPMLAVRPALEASEKSMAAIAHISPDEPLLLLDFDISFDGSGGQLQWLVPYSMFEPVINTLKQGLASGTDSAPGYWQENMRTSLRATKVKMSYGLSSKQVTLSHLLALDVGDIVPIDSGSAVVSVNSRDLFAASLREQSGELCLELEKRVDQ